MKKEMLTVCLQNPLYSQKHKFQFQLKSKEKMFEMTLSDIYHTVTTDSLF